MKEYISKEEALEVVRQAYQCYLPHAHGVIMFIENGITNLKPADVRGFERARWIPTRKHIWKKDINGQVDELVWENGFHGGPYCTLCFESPCACCNPNYDDLENCHKHYICSHCGKESLYRDAFCACGAVMEEEENK